MFFSGWNPKAYAICSGSIWFRDFSRSWRSVLAFSARRLERKAGSIGWVSSLFTILGLLSICLRIIGSIFYPFFSKFKIFSLTAGFSWDIATASSSLTSRSANRGAMFFKSIFLFLRISLMTISLVYDFSPKSWLITSGGKSLTILIKV